MSDSPAVTSKLDPPKARKVYPWKTMRVGESFRTATSIASTRGLISNANLRYAPKIFRAGKDEQGKARIWRVR